MDENAARRAFETALRTATPEFEKFFLCRFYGLEFNYVGERLIVDFPISDHLYNPQGGLHGGVSSFILDVAMGHLLWHTMGTSGSTLEMKAQYLAPVRGSRGRCESWFLRKGRGICFLEAHLKDENDVVAVVGTSTWRVNKPANSPKNQTEAQGQRVDP